MAGTDGPHAQDLHVPSTEVVHPATIGPLPGWLIAFSVSAGLLTPLGAGVTLFSSSFLNFTVPLAWSLFISFSWLMTLLIGVAGPVTAFSLLKGRRYSIALARGFCLAALLFWGTSTGWLAVLTIASTAGDPLVSKGLYQGSGRFLYYLCWVMYFHRSVRVSELEAQARTLVAPGRS